MKHIRTFTFAALALLLTAAIIKATTVTECQAVIAELKAQTASVTLTKRSAEKDREGLVGKLNAAALALDQAKFCDSIKKLNDYKIKVNQLVAAGAINTDPANGVTAQELLAGADNAIACVSSLVSQSGTTCPL